MGCIILKGCCCFRHISKKENMQSRAVELESAISLFENDIICGSNRFESWFLLGQSYGYLVEDDLIWTADKLTASDRKLLQPTCKESH